MKTLNSADMQGQLSKPVEQVAQISAIGKLRKPIDLAALRALTDAMPMQSESAGDFVRRMRDEDRY